VEDQSADSGDLTADAAAASAPQGKSARNRHRLPRQRPQQTESSDGDVVAESAIVEESVAAEEPAPAEVPASEVDVATEAEEPAVESAATAEPVEPKQRRRMPWRRGSDTAAVEAPIATAVSDVPEVSDAAERAESGEPSEPADHEADPEATGESEGDSETVPVVLVPHRTAGRALKFVAVAAGVAFVAAATFAGAMIQPYLADRAAVHTKFVIAETAASAITTLWTYTPDDMDKLPERSAKYLGGDFAADYKRYIDAIVAPNKQAQVTNNTQVLGAAVESLTPTEATAIVYTNSVATSPVTKGIPSLRYLSYRLTMKPDDNRWLITQMVAVTKLDLTPRL
jgi:Mce-associated membrane protein